MVRQSVLFRSAITGCPAFAGHDNRERSVRRKSLLSAAAVRERAHEMLAAGLRGELAHFTVDLESLSMAAHVVSELIRVNYPDLKVPFHARWRHFVIGERDLWAERTAQAAWTVAGREGASRVRSRDHLGAARCGSRAVVEVSRPRRPNASSRVPKA